MALSCFVFQGDCSCRGLYLSTSRHAIVDSQGFLVLSARHPLFLLSCRTNRAGRNLFFCLAIGVGVGFMSFFPSCRRWGNGAFTACDGWLAANVSFFAAMSQPAVVMLSDEERTAWLARHRDAGLPLRIFGVEVRRVRGVSAPRTGWVLVPPAG